MNLSFWKTVCLGNTFLHVQEEGVPHPLQPEALGTLLCDPIVGAGADGLTLTTPREPDGCAFTIINRDGTRAEVSGNGMAGAAAVRFLGDPHLTEVHFSTAAGPRTVALRGRPQEHAFQLSVDLGVPLLQTPEANGMTQPLLLSVGNPQAVFRVANPSCLPGEEEQERLYQEVVSSYRLAEGVNVAWCAPLSGGTVLARYRERGAGPTPASGTGAAAIHTALRHWGLAPDNLQIISPGGQVSTHYAGDRITLENLCYVLYKGTWLCDPEMLRLSVPPQEG